VSISISRRQFIGRVAGLATMMSVISARGQSGTDVTLGWVRANVPKGAKEVGTYKGRRYRITTSNYHSFGPRPPGVKDNSSIIATVYLVALDGKPPDPDLTPIRAWFVADERRVWQTTFSDEPRLTYTDRIEKVARGGPQKGVDSPRFVDVVVLVKAGLTDMLLIAKKQAIAG
jgi:hypothetical protein